MQHLPGHRKRRSSQHVRPLILVNVYVIIIYISLMWKFFQSEGHMMIVIWWSYVFRKRSWPCLHQWLETRPTRQVCPVCKAAISRDKVIPLYGRGATKHEDPRYDAVFADWKLHRLQFHITYMLFVAYSFEPRCANVISAVDARLELVFVRIHFFFFRNEHKQIYLSLA